MRAAVEIEVELTRRQVELEYLDETSRKELSVPVAELEAPEDSTPEHLQTVEAAVSRDPDEDRESGRCESDRVRGISGSAAALRLPERAAAGSDRFDSGH